MLICRLCTDKNFRCEFKPVFRNSKPYTYSTLIGEENETFHYTLYLGQQEQEHEHNNRKMKTEVLLNKSREEKEKFRTNIIRLYFNALFIIISFYL